MTHFHRYIKQEEDGNLVEIGMDVNIPYIMNPSELNPIPENYIFKGKCMFFENWESEGRIWKESKSFFLYEIKTNDTINKNKEESIALKELPTEKVNHPSYYGGKDNPLEAIKIIEYYGLDFNLGNTIKYILRAGVKDQSRLIEDLKKAQWYLNREIENLTK